MKPKIKHGKKVLASGRGLGPKLFAICKRRGLSMDNSVLVVRNPNDLDSPWIIYEK